MFAILSSGAFGTTGGLVSGISKVPTLFGKLTGRLVSLGFFHLSPT